MKQPYEAPMVIKLGQLKDLTKNTKIGYSTVEVCTDWC